MREREREREDRKWHVKRKCSTILLERKRKDHRQSDQHWNCFKDSSGKMSEMGWSAYGLS